MKLILSFVLALVAGLVICADGPPRLSLTKASTVADHNAVLAFDPGHSQQAAPTLGYSILLDFKDGDVIPVVSMKLSEVPGFLGRWNAQLWGLAGYNVNDSQANLGVGLVIPVRLADNFRAWLGGAARAEPTASGPGIELRLGIVLGVQIEVK